MKNTLTAKRNGKIEFMRFFFSMCVLLVHIEGTVYGGVKSWGWFTLANRGYIGVEFFFLVSGYLLGKKLAALDPVRPDRDTLGGETCRFLWGKLRPILPYHFIFCGVMILLWAIHYSAATFWTVFLERAYTLFFLHRTGIGGASPKDILGLEWYICSMLLAMALLYPIGRRYGKAFRCLAPIAGILICGYLTVKTGHLHDAYSMLGITYKCNWRALGELLIGLGCYEASCAIRERCVSRKNRFLLAVTEVCCYALVALYAFSDLDVRYDIYALCLLAVAITISFSGSGAAANSPVFNNALCGWLGKISLPIYLAQAPVLSFLPVIWKTATTRQMSFGILGCTVGMGVAAWAIVAGIQKHRAVRKAA